MQQGLEVAHAKVAHNFPTCLLCNTTFDETETPHNFYRHISSHTLAVCEYPGCTDQVIAGMEVQHATEKHKFPACPTCEDNSFQRYDKFYIHIKLNKCAPEETRDCPYPDCEETVYTNRPALTRQHFDDEHNGTCCERCNMDSELSIQLFIRHVEKCYTTFSCSSCLFNTRSQTKFRRHLCVPKTTEEALKFDAAMDVFERTPATLRIRDNHSQLTRHASCVFRNSTMDNSHFPQMDDNTRKKTKSNMQRDPTCVEMLSMCDLPVIALFLPREDDFESRMRILHVLEQQESDLSWLWCLLVDRIAEFGRDLWADDVRFLRGLLQQIDLPPGVKRQSHPDDRKNDFKDLDIIRAHVKLLKETAYENRRNVSVLYESEAGFRPLKDHMRHLNEARSESDRVKRTNQLLLEDGKVHGYESEQVLHRNVLPALTAGTTGISTRALSELETKWDAMLYQFFRDVMVPVVNSRKFVRLADWGRVRLNFFGDNLFLSKIAKRRVEQQRKRIRCLPHQASDPIVMQSQRMAYAQADREEQYIQEQWWADRELSSNGAGVKRDEVENVLEKLQRLCSRPERWATTPLHPRCTPYAGPLGDVPGGASASSGSDVKRARVEEIE